MNYSQKPSAVRMRRMRARQRKARATGEPQPIEVTTWHCPCGAVCSLGGWNTHKERCLFAPDAYPVVVKRATPASGITASSAEPAGSPAPVVPGHLGAK